MKIQLFLSAAIVVLLAASCSKKDDFSSAPLSAYFPLQTGKYFIYRLDSLVFTNAGRTEETHSYLAKDTIDAQLTDNEGRTVYRVHRFLQDTAATQPWTDDITYIVTPTTTTIEVDEDNLRFTKLCMPVTPITTWRGNSKLGDYPYQQFYGDLTSQSSLQNWVFSYQNIDQSVTIGQQTFDSTITVFQNDDSINLPITSDSVFANKSYGLERYARGIGLVYREYILWDFQPSKNGSSSYKEGFGVKLYLIDHN